MANLLAPGHDSRVMIGQAVRRAVLVAFLVLAPIVSSSASAQEQQPAQPSRTTEAPPTGLLKVFVDCQWRCDQEYLRQNVGFVDYVRDRAVADVHVLVTTQNTGGGGLSWTVKFIGLGRLQGQDRTLGFSTIQTASDDDRRKEFARVFRIGIVGYAADTIASPQLDVNWTKPKDTVVQATAASDPWNFWVFRLNTNGNMNGERTTSYQSFRFNVSANRTTDKWKINLNSYANYNTNRFELDDGSVVKSLSSSWSTNGLVVKSLTPKWSAGVRASLNSSSYSNNDRSVTTGFGFEYDFFPYSESSRRSLTIQYTAGPNFYRYREITIYDKLSEVVPDHRVFGRLALRQPWGSLELNSAVSQHLNHFDRYRSTTFGQADVRLFKGFSFNIFGEYERINDQIGLRKGTETTEDVLLRLRQRATSYSYYVSFGVSYSFGSIFNSIVNTRFGGF